MKTGIIFDVDGTLWDSSAQVAGVWQSIIDAHDDLKRPCTREDLLNNMGKPMPEIAAAIFPGVSEEKQRQYLKEAEENENSWLAEHLPECYEGVTETLRILAEEYPLFIVSNCQTGYIDLCIRSAQAEDLITDFCCYGDNNLPKWDNIRAIAEKHGLKKYYYVGDTAMDYEAAQKADSIFIFASYGFGTVSDDVPAIGDIRELPQLMKKI